MFSFLSYVFIVPLIGAFFYLDGPHIVSNTVSIKWKNFRKINNLVASNYKGIFTIIWISLYMVIQALWISLIQYMNSSVVFIGKGKYRVTYVIKGKTYKMIVIPVRGPRKVLLVSNENQFDVSHEIFPYLGPEENFHNNNNNNYTPEFFGYHELIFEMTNGEEKIFKGDDNILL